MSQEDTADNDARQDDSGEITIEEMEQAEQDPNHPLRDPDNPRHRDFLAAQETARKMLAGVAGLMMDHIVIERLNEALRPQLLKDINLDSFRTNTSSTLGTQAAEWRAALCDPTGLADMIRKFSEDLKLRTEWAKPPSFLGRATLCSQSRRIYKLRD